MSKDANAGTPKPRRGRRALRIAAWIPAVVIVPLALGLLALATSPGRSTLASLIERAARVNGISITIVNLSGWPPFHFGAEKVVIADANGPFAEIQNLDAKLRLRDLFTGGVGFESIAVERASISRRPVLVSEDTESDAVSLTLDRIAIARLELGEALTGRPAALVVAASYAYRTSGETRANVNAERVDGKAGNLNVTLARTERKAPFLIDAKAEEGTDGILIGLLGRETGPGYRLQAKTEVTERVLEGTLTLASDGAARFNGKLSLGLDGDDRKVVASGDGDFGELLPPDFAPLLAGAVHVGVDAQWTPVKDALPRVAIREAVVRSANLRVEATGVLDETAPTLKFSVDLARPDGAPLALPGAPDVRIGSVALTGSASRAMNVTRLEASGVIAGFSAPELSLPRAEVALGVSSAGDKLLAGSTLPFSVRIAAPSATIAGERIVSGTNAPIALQAEGNFDKGTKQASAHATLAIGATTARFDGTLSGKAVEGKLAAHLADLRLFTTFTGRPLKGTLDATASGTFHSAAGVRLDIAGDAQNFDPGDATAAKLFAGKSHVATKLATGPGGTLSLSGLALDAAALKASGNATMGAKTIDASIEGRLADLGLLARDTQGAARFALKATGATTAPNLDASLRVDQAKVFGKAVEQVSARLTGQPVPRGWSGHLALDGRYAGKRIDGNADASLETGSNLLDIPRIDIAVGDNRIRGGIKRTASGVLGGALDVDAPDLATLAALALVEASGAATAKVTFTSPNARQAVAVTFNGRDIKYSDVHAAAAAGAVDIADPFGAPQVRGNLEATMLAVGGFKLDTASARATVAGDTTRFSVSAKNADLDLSGSGSLPAKQGNALQVRIDTLTGTAYKLPVKLAAPAAIDIDGNRVAVRNAALSAGGGTLRADGAVAPEFNLTIAADKVSATLANAFAPQLALEGALTGRASLTGKPAALAIRWQVDGTGLRVAATKSAGLPPLALKARGDATLSGTSIDAQVSGAGASFNVKGKIPYAGRGLALQGDGTVPLGLLALESSRELRLGGSIRANVAVSGAIDAPEITGAAELVDATIADSETAFGVTGARGRIAFNGKQASLEQIAGRLLQGGQVTLGGTIDITGKGLPAKLQANVENGRYADGRVVNTTFSGKLGIDGPLLGDGVVSGNIALGRTEIELPDRLGGAASAIQVKHVNTKPSYKDPLARREGAEGGAGTGGALKLAIELSNTRGIFVRGFGIDAEFGGSLKLTGTLGSPQAVGAFTMQRGRIELLGKRLDMSSGRLTFAGDLVPLLDFKATTTTASSDVSVTMNVTGPANDPVIALTSSPELPQEEILSRVLFERSVGALSPLQAVQLIDAVARFTGAIRGSSALDRIRKATGLDDLDVRQNAAGGTTVGVGRRVSDNVRLGVEAGTGSTAGRVTVDLEITKELKARGEAGQQGAGKVGLTWEHEY